MMIVGNLKKFLLYGRLMLKVNFAKLCVNMVCIVLYCIKDF